MRLLVLLALLVGAIELAVSCSPPDYIFPRATPALCNDEEINGRETDVDCGGLDCEPCANGLSCRFDGDCVLGICTKGVCQAAHCADNSLNYDETDVDCGGKECRKCGVNQRCSVATDCTSNRCACQGPDCPAEGEPLPPNLQKKCLATGCDDGVKNNNETDKDCGGGTCPGCAFAKVCSNSGDCANGLCIAGRCSIEQCVDGVRAPDEQGVDCGGICPKPCDDPDACSDKIRNNNETDKDCGGGTCPRCNVGQLCSTNLDCISENCVAGKCEENPCKMGDCMPDPGTGGTTGAAGAPDVPEGGDGGAAMGEGGAPSMGGTSGGPNGGAPQGGAAGGSPPMGGSGGASGGEGGTLTGGTAGTAGAGGGPLKSCPGCARLSVPLADASHKANFVIKLSNLTSFANAKITFRVYKEAGSGGSVKGYVQHGPDNFDGQAYRQLFQQDAEPLSTLVGWKEFTWDVGAHPTDFNKYTVARVGIQVTGAEATSWTNPTIVYVDSITVTDASVTGWTFDNSGSVFPNPTTDTNPNVIWLNAGDNPVGGAQVSWVGP